MLPYTNWRTLGVLSPVVAVTLWLVGCASDSAIPEPLDPTRVLMEVRVEPDANPDPKGRYLPIVVRLFQVRAPGEFEQSDFFDLFDKTPTLAADGYQQLDELEMAGGDQRSTQHELDASVRYVGAIAAFRQINDSTWIAIAPVMAGGLNQVTVDVTRLRVNVSSQLAP